MKFSPIFTDHAVLAAHRIIRIFGDGIGDITVTLAEITVKTVAEDGHWCVEFPAMEYGGPYELKLQGKNETITLTDIYIGEVYLFAGQSNMQFKLYESNTTTEKYGDLDLLRYTCLQSPEIQSDMNFDSSWAVSRAEKVANWSAIAYLAARDIALNKGIAVGAIGCAQGASVIESWVPRGTFEKNGITVAPECKFADHFFEQYSSWNGDGMLYEKMLSKIIPYSLTGVVWYQGESDTSFEEGKVYAEELQTLIKVWRHDFRDLKLPFVIVQLADYIHIKDRPGWQLVQQAQVEVGNNTSNVTTVICKDICEKDMIHPVSKDALSMRIAEALIKLTK